MESTELVVRKAITVARPPEVAFRVFTEGVAEWWPTKTHSIGEERVETVIFESGVGGRIYERHNDGSEHEWGRVTEWEPPGRVVYTWYPGRGPETGQTVEVRFTADDDGTRVDVDQRGWELLGEEAEGTRASYDGESGWNSVLRLYAEAAERAA